MGELEWEDQVEDGRERGIRQRIQKETAKIKDCMWGSMKSLIKEKHSKIYKHMKTI